MAEGHCMMMRHEATWKRTLAALVLVVALVADDRAGAAEPSSLLRDRAWTWGYVIPGQVPGDVPFVGKSTCSLEAGAAMLGTPNVVFMNSCDDRATLTDEYLRRFDTCKQVICALQHNAYADAAKRVSSLSKSHPNITGALIDDFRDPPGPSHAITPAETKAIRDALRSENPSLRLYVVRYAEPKQTQEELLPFLPYIDAINLWVWEAEEKPWRETLEPEIDRIRELTQKPILLGLFMHDYGRTGKAIAMNVLELQTKKAMELARSGRIEGFVILQSGWFHHQDHQPQVQWLKQYMNSEDMAGPTKP
jgi:hypothetical protein